VLGKLELLQEMLRRWRRCSLKFAHAHFFIIHFKTYWRDNLLIVWL